MATAEVGANEQVDRSVAAETQPGDVEGMTDAITAMLDRLATTPAETRALARAEAERLFAPEVCVEYPWRCNGSSAASSTRPSSVDDRVRSLV